MTPTEPTNGHEKLRGAEYALGVLDAEQRRAFERQMREDPELAAAVEAWHARLAPLAEEIASVEPAPYVWARIKDELDLRGEIDTTPAAGTPPQNRGFWHNLPLWHWVGIGASAVAVASLVLLFTLPRPGPAPRQPAMPSAQQVGYLAANIQQNKGVAGWTATIDVSHARMIVVPATTVAVAANKSTQLWLIPPGHKPISLGLIARDHPTRVTLSKALLKQAGNKALLAVSVEPPGGSPTGQPTGPVIAKGPIHGA